MDRGSGRHSVQATREDDARSVGRTGARRLITGGLEVAVSFSHVYKELPSAMPSFSHTNKWIHNYLSVNALTLIVHVKDLALDNTATVYLAVVVKNTFDAIPSHEKKESYRLGGGRGSTSGVLDVCRAL